MKRIIIPIVISGAVLTAGSLTALAMHRTENRPEPDLSISRASFDDYRSQVFYEQQQAEAVHKQQLAAVITENNSLAKQKSDLCTQLINHRLTNPHCN